jgi:hypothetical protein
MVTNLAESSKEGYGSKRAVFADDDDDDDDENKTTMLSLDKL